MNRIPLTQRLEGNLGGEWRLPAAFALYTEDYFETIAKIRRNLYYKYSFQKEMLEIELKQKEYMQVFQMAAKADDTEPEIRCDILYRLLIEPFAQIEPYTVRKVWENTRNGKETEQKEVVDR